METKQDFNYNLAEFVASGGEKRNYFPHNIFPLYNRLATQIYRTYYKDIQRKTGTDE